MGQLVPKGIPEEAWVRFEKMKDYAVLCGPEDRVFFKIGPGHGLVLSVEPSPKGWTVNTISFENGEAEVVSNFPTDTKCVLGRTSESTIKVVQPVISRHHMELTLRGNVLMVRDLGSTNGTYLLEEIIHFDIANYLAHHPIGVAATETTDRVHEDFGVLIDDFLKNYAQSIKEEK